MFYAYLTGLPLPCSLKSVLNLCAQKNRGYKGHYAIMLIGGSLKPMQKHNNSSTLDNLCLIDSRYAKGTVLFLTFLHFEI